MFKIKQYKSFSEREDLTIEFWKKNKIFEKSIENRPRDKKYVFVDGPPFVTGNPHYGSLLPSIIKDVVPRYQAMKGNRVRRVWGWDCHGLPIEEKINKKFDLHGRKQIENDFGVERYVHECRSFVEQCISEWKWYIDKVGRWVDLDNPYRTMDPQFNESVIWAFKNIYEKGLIYKGKRVSLFSTDTSTPVSQFEVAMDPDNYREIQDLSVFVKFKIKDTKIKDLKDTYLVAWTTTPWTLPSNFALAVNPKLTYILVQHSGKSYILAKDRLEYAFKEMDGKTKIIREFQGKELEGISYHPVYEFYKDKVNHNDYKVYLSNDVVNDEGTGILHIAPGFGEVDYNLGKKFGISDYQDIDEEGKLLVGPWKGVYIRKANKMIEEDLETNEKLLRSEMYSHRVPFYRGENPLIYMAQEAYFIDIQKIKDQMLKTNENINWIPDHFKHGRMEETIKTAPDWCISRNRYWATIMPIWKSEDGDELIIGSFDEMMQYTKQITKKIENEKAVYFIENEKMTLHRDSCDKVVLEKNGKKYYRVPEVLDVWMDSGSVPFAEYHYPFENVEEFEQGFPADFIVEYVGQIRAWFNVLIRVSTMLFGKTPFKNVVCTGTLAGTDGRKMSKSFGNYPDPKNTIIKYGGDALRMYFMGSPIVVGGDMNFNENDLKNQVTTVLFPLWNIYKYFVTYANLSNWKPSRKSSKSKNKLDLWILSRLKEFHNEFEKHLSEYEIPSAVRLMAPFLDDLSTWYIRRSRDRFAKFDENTLNTLYEVLLKFVKLTAPIIPFMTEEIYLSMKEESIELTVESVHLADYPDTEKVSPSEVKLLETMRVLRSISSLGQSARVQTKIKLRQPLQKVEVQGYELEEWMKEIIKEELNVKEVIVSKIKGSGLNIQTAGEIKVKLDTTMSPELKSEGLIRELIRSIQDLRKKSGLEQGKLVDIRINTSSTDIENAIKTHMDELKKNVGAKKLEMGTTSENAKVLKVEGEIVSVEF